MSTQLHLGIPVSITFGTDEPHERCCFCRTPTVEWTLLEDRTPGQQVACCGACARLHAPFEVPTKGEWCDAEDRAEGRLTLAQRQARPATGWRRA